MKKFFSFVAAFVAVATVFSCSKNNDIAPVEESVQVRFSVEVPAEQLTKTIGNGTNANVLDFAVYLDGTYLPKMEAASNAEVTLLEEGKWSVVLTLVKNLKYDVVFWAHAQEAPYTFNKAKAQIVVDNYTSAANSDLRDAFYKCINGYVATEEPVEADLTRPFAQINVGADDYNPFITDLGIKMTSKIDTKAVATVTVPNVLNVLDGSVSGAAQLDFALASIPYETGDKTLVTYNNVEYSWVSMNYVLAGAEQTLSTLKATFHYNAQDLEINVANVPYKRNYKTNILGSLFTQSSEFQVVIVPNFDGTLLPSNN